jgi:protein-arginine kinase activator protein McsA
VTNQLDKLRSELQKAVENEDYERAADLRDQIKKIESGS